MPNGIASYEPDAIGTALDEVGGYDPVGWSETLAPSSGHDVGFGAVTAPYIDEWPYFPHSYGWQHYPFETPEEKEAEDAMEAAAAVDGNIR